MEEYIIKITFKDDKIEEYDPFVSIDLGLNNVVNISNGHCEYQHNIERIKKIEFIKIKGEE